eukprot:GFUD01092094.1.p1 GENE.GFUD01092094.1~~GFUD01092094.1.p1  ORF type:complete len:133 (+),score=3.64 GFUD01092094.1:731-1129(+)
MYPIDWKHAFVLTTVVLLLTNFLRRPLEGRIRSVRPVLTKSHCCFPDYIGITCDVFRMFNSQTSCKNNEYNNNTLGTARVATAEEKGDRRRKAEILTMVFHSQNLAKISKISRYLSTMSRYLSTVSRYLSSV